MSLVWSPGAERWVEVEEAPEEAAVPPNLDKFKSRRGSAASATAGAKRGGLWAKVSLAHLVDREWDKFYPARTRLLLYLRIKSFRGTKTVRLTNEMAAEIGLDRFQKKVCLQHLEQGGHIRVVRSGQKVAAVTVLGRG